MSLLAVFSLRNRALIALITIVSAVFGGLALTNLKQELIPSLEFPALLVMTTYPGASPAVVEHDVSTPIEAVIQAVPGLESTTATSTTNASVIQAMFAYGTNLASAEQKIQQAINRIKSDLPDDVSPQVLSLSLDAFPVIQVAVSGLGDAQQTQQTLESLALPELEDIPGVSTAQIVGGIGQRITITPDPALLAAAGLSSADIRTAVQQNGVLFPGGAITEDGLTLTVQTGAKLTSTDELAALSIVGSQKTIGDLATVVAEADPITSLSRVNGTDSLTIAITKLPAANTVDVSKGVLGALDGFAQTIPAATFTVVFDQAPFIVQSIETLAVEGLLGLVFAVVVILVFLLSIRSTLVTAISIPTSVLITFVGLQAFGYSLNILTLGALTIAIGRVVDDSIVVIENIKRHYVVGADKGGAIRQAVREVAAAITASTITTVAVFLPIIFVGDMVGELFRPFSMTVVIAMAASLLVALTIVPVLAYWFLKPSPALVDETGQIIDPESPAAPPTRLQQAYLPILRWTLNHSVATVLIAVLVLGGTVLLAPLMKINFLGDSGQNTVTVTQNLEPGASLATKDAAAIVVEQALADVPGVETVQVSIGSSGSALRDAFSGGAGATFSIMTAEDANAEEVRAGIENMISGLTDVGDVSMSASTGFGSSDIAVTVSASTPADLIEATETLSAAISGREGVGTVSTNLATALPYIAVVVDREAAAARGLSEVAVGGMVSAAMRPQNIGSLEAEGQNLPIFLATANPPQTQEELRSMKIPSAVGMVPLTDIATIEQRLSPTSITTVQGRQTATITVPPASDNLATATASVNEAIAQTALPEGARAEVGGVAAQQADSFSQLGLAMLAAILIVYVVMVATFRSLRQPLLLLISVPFAATGAILLQLVTGVPLGVASLIGVLMLIGIVVTNAIVLVDLVNQYREKGLSVIEATLAGGQKRLRPILMTALATIFALIPMALGITGHSGFISQPLAIVVIGGLISSTVLTLIVLPTLYNLVEGARERRAVRRGSSESGDSAPETPAPGSPAPGSPAPFGPESPSDSASKVHRPVNAGEPSTETGSIVVVGPDGQPRTRREMRELGLL